MTNKTKNYIFLDESGKPEIFSAQGENLVLSGKATKYLILAAVRTNDQLKLQQKTTELKSMFLGDKNLAKFFSSKYSLDNFHARVDYPKIKEKFYYFINSQEVKIDILAVDKLKCYPGLQRKPGRMYGVMAGHLLKNICHQSDFTEIIFSRKDSSLKLRQELEFEVDRIRLNYLNGHPNLDPKFKLSYFHNPHYSHAGLQIADYAAYAVFCYFEKGDGKWLKIIHKKIGKIHDICNKKYFTRSNPLQLST